MQKIETKPISYTYTKNNSRYIKDLNVKLKAIKAIRTLENNLGNISLDIGKRKDFMTKITKATETKANLTNQM